jgi:RNA polymerase sigma factor (sigma-70 family)
LFVLVRHSAIDWLRDMRRRRYVDLVTVSVNASPFGNLTAAEEREEVQRRLREVVAALPTRDRDIFCRFYSDADSPDQLARAFGKSEQTIRRVLSHTKKYVLARLGGVKLTNAEVKQLMECSAAVR